MPEPQTIDELIEQQAAEADQREADARALIARMRLVPGAVAFLSRRRKHGEIPNPWAEPANLSAQSAILQRDPSLAQYLARLAGKQLDATSDDELDRQRQRQEAIDRMRAETEAMAARNAAVRHQKNREMTYGSFDNFHGRMI